MHLYILSSNRLEASWYSATRRAASGCGNCRCAILVTLAEILLSLEENSSFLFVRLAVAAVVLLVIQIVVIVVVGDESGRYLQLYSEQYPDLDPSA